METKKFGFGKKLLMILSSVIVFCLGVIIFINAYIGYKTSEEETKKYVQEMSYNYGNLVKNILEKGLLVSKQVANRYEYMIKNNSNISREESLEYLKSTLKSMKELQGFWIGIKKTNLYPEKKESDPVKIKNLYDVFGVFNPSLKKNEDGSIEVSAGAGYSMDFDWIAEPSKSGKAYLTAPYVFGNVLMVSTSYPIFVNGEYFGVIGTTFRVEGLNKFVKNLKIFDSGYAVIWDEHCNVLAHKNKDLIGKNAHKVSILAKDKYVGNLCKKIKDGKNYEFEKISTSNGLKSYYFANTFNASNLDQHWSFMVSVPEDEYLASAKSSRNLSIIAGLITLLVIILILLYVSKILNKNISSISNGLIDFFKFLNKENDNTSKIEINSNDEFGEMAEQINENIEKVEQNIKEENILIEDVKKVVNSVNDGLFYKRVQANSNNKIMNDLKDLINHMLETLENLVGRDINETKEILQEYSNANFLQKLSEKTGLMGGELRKLHGKITQMLQANQAGGLSLENSAKELTDNISVLTNNATSQAASLEETAASIEEITGNIQSTNQRAQEMYNISSDTKDSASKGKDLANQTAKSMDEINEQVSSINEAITVIDQIAFQTNILSLNAAVEAATAGEAGKGFAVVAQEVRNLASRSAEAAKEIKELVETATSKANTGKDISTSMIEGFSELEENILKTSNLINDVSSAAKEQSSAMSQIADAINQLDKFTQENASIADRTNSISNETLKIATEFVKEANKNDFEGKKQTLRK